MKWLMGVVDMQSINEEQTGIQNKINNLITKILFRLEIKVGSRTIPNKLHSIKSHINSVLVRTEIHHIK